MLKASLLLLILVAAVCCVEWKDIDYKLNVENDRGVAVDAIYEVQDTTTLPAKVRRHARHQNDHQIHLNSDRIIFG